MSQTRAQIKSNIDSNITTNGTGEITGSKLRGVLNNMADNLVTEYAGYQYAGIAVLTPAQTDPGTPDGKVFYITSQAGTYTNFGSLVVAEGEIAVLKYNGTAWSKDVTGAATKNELNQLGQNTNIINVNQANSVPNTAYESAVVARGAVPADSRRYGVVVSYLLSDGWHIEQYNGPAVNPWQTADQYWIPYGSHPELVIYNVNVGYSHTGHTLAEAIALVPSQYRGIARAITFLDTDANCVFALFNGESYISGWTNPNNWTIYDKNVFLSVITGNVGVPSKGVLSIQGTSSRQFIVGDALNPGVLVNSKEFYFNVKNIDAFGYWRIYLFFADGTKEYDYIVGGLNTFEKEVVGFSIALNANTNLCTLDYEVFTGVRCEIEKKQAKNHCPGE